MIVLILGFFTMTCILIFISKVRECAKRKKRKKRKAKVELEISQSEEADTSET